MYEWGVGIPKVFLLLDLSVVRQNVHSVAASVKLVQFFIGLFAYKIFLEHKLEIFNSMQEGFYAYCFNKNADFP